MEKKIPIKQMLVADLLANGVPVKLISEQLDISISQIYKYKKIPAFNKYVNELLIEKEKSSYQELFALKPMAVETIKDCLKSKDARTKLRAAELLMRFGI